MPKHLLTLTALGLATLPATAASAIPQSALRTPHSDAPPARPNIILILADDLGYGDLACHGNPTVKTPRLDKFARESIELTSFRVSPVSAPTRASTLTGRWNFRTGVPDVRPQSAQIDPAEILIAAPLKAAGYATAMFGKWHLGNVTAKTKNSPNALGFDETLTFAGSALRQYFDPPLYHNGAPIKTKGYSQDIFTDAAIAFIRKTTAANKPFFIYLPYNLIHTPLQVPTDLENEYDNLGLRDSTRKIYGMVRSVDTTFGRLLDTLKTLGIENNTLVIFLSDNGPCSSSKPFDRYMAGLRGLKGTVYENGIRVPCFMRWPAAFKTPATITRPAAHIDLFPTILAACEVPVPPTCALDGINLLPILKNPKGDYPDRTFYFQWDSAPVPRRGQAYTVVTEQWKLVQPCGMDDPNQAHIRAAYAELCRQQNRAENATIDGPARYELYNLATDPAETQNQATAHPEIVAKLKAQYDAWFTDTAKRWSP